MGMLKCEIVEFSSKEFSKKTHPKRDIKVYILRKAGLDRDITGVPRGMRYRHAYSYIRYKETLSRPSICENVEALCGSWL